MNERVKLKVVKYTKSSTVAITKTINLAGPTNALYPATIRNTFLREGETAASNNANGISLKQR